MNSNNNDEHWQALKKISAGLLGKTTSGARVYYDLKIHKLAAVTNQSIEDAEKACNMINWPPDDLIDFYLGVGRLPSQDEANMYRGENISEIVRFSQETRQMPSTEIVEAIKRVGIGAVMAAINFDKTKIDQLPHRYP